MVKLGEELTLGERLRKARRFARLTQAELAERVGISGATASNYESDLRHPPFDVVVLWSQATGVELDFFVSAVATVSGQHHRRNDHWSTDDASTVRERHAAWLEAGQLTLLQPVAA